MNFKIIADIAKIKDINNMKLVVGPKLIIDFPNMEWEISTNDATNSRLLTNVKETFEETYRAALSSLLFTTDPAFIEAFYDKHTVEKDKANGILELKNGTVEEFDRVTTNMSTLTKDENLTNLITGIYDYLVRDMGFTDLDDNCFIDKDGKLGIKFDSKYNSTTSPTATYMIGDPTISLVLDGVASNVDISYNFKKVDFNKLKETLNSFFNKEYDWTAPVINELTPKDEIDKIVEAFKAIRFNPVEGLRNSIGFKYTYNNGIFLDISRHGDVHYSMEVRRYFNGIVFTNKDDPSVYGAENMQTMAEVRLQVLGEPLASMIAPFYHMYHLLHGPYYQYLSPATYTNADGTNVFKQLLKVAGYNVQQYESLPLVSIEYNKETDVLSIKFHDSQSTTFNFDGLLMMIQSNDSTLLTQEHFLSYKGVIEGLKVIRYHYKAL